MATQPKTFLTPQQYLEIERKADYKSEYFNGEMFAIAGAREAHNLLVANLVRELGEQFRMRPCRVYPGDVRVHVKSTGLYTYPDVTAVCGARNFIDDRTDTLLNPALSVEVLSPSTEACDRGRKFGQYQSIESLREYLLVASDRMHVDLYARQADGRWMLTSASLPEDSLTLESVGAKLLLSDLYEKVELSPESPDTNNSRAPDRQ
jgi:Uma2 family endonuclease